MTRTSLQRLTRAMLPLALLLLAHGQLGAQIHGAGDSLTGPRRPLQTEGVQDPKRAYRLRPGDTISISFRFTPEFNEELLVLPDGTAVSRAAGSLQAEGLTLAEFQTLTREAAKTRLLDPELTVTLKDFERPHVYVAGEVNAPGRQDLRRPTTATQAILMCGGPKDDAALGRVLLFRRINSETAEVHVLELAHYNRKVRDDNDMILEPDDILLVRHDLPSRFERYIRVANIGLYLNPLQNVGLF